MKEELDKKTQRINSHTSSEADRIIKETACEVMSAFKQNTQALPGQVAVAAKMASPAVTVGVLNSILNSKGIICQGVKADKAEWLATHVPVHELILLLEEHAGTATPRPKAESKGTSSIATASTALPSEQTDSDSDDESSSEAPPPKPRKRKGRAPTSISTPESEPEQKRARHVPTENIEATTPGKQTVNVEFSTTCSSLFTRMTNTIIAELVEVLNDYGKMLMFAMLQSWQGM